MTVRIKRVYEAYDSKDGYRILIDRLWPRGVSKSAAHIDLWLKEIAPSAELRKWFNHEEKYWEEFQKRYRVELQQNPDTVAELKHIIDTHTSVTLLYGTRDEIYNHAHALRRLLKI